MFLKKITLFFLLISQVIIAQIDIKNANTLYKQGQYQDAIDVYETIIYRGQKQSAELYFNLGNCYYKLNKVAPSVYNYEKALLENADFEAAKINLEIAKKMQIDDLPVIEKVGTAVFIRNLTSVFHYDSWAWMSVIFAMLFLLFFIGYYFSKASLLKRILFTAMLVVFAGVLISVASAIFEKSEAEKYNPAIVFADVAPLIIAPKNDSKEIIKLHSGTKVFVLEQKNNYKKVQTTNNIVGWIKSESVKELKK